jgi:hypothetical protein
MSELTPEEILARIIGDHLLFADVAYKPDPVSAIATAIREAESAAYERGKADEREACAAIADKWGQGKWRVEIKDGRQRFELRHLQQHVNTTGRCIAEDIRQRSEAPND